MNPVKIPSVQNRITAVGFVLALSVFSLRLIAEPAKALGTEGIFVYLQPYSLSVLAIGWSLLALGLFLAAAALDGNGEAHLGTTASGEVLLSLAIAQFMSGGLGHLYFTLFEGLQKLEGADVSMVSALSPWLRLWVSIPSVIAWLGFMYALPAWCVVRVHRADAKVARWVVGGVATAGLLVTIFAGAASDLVRARGRHKELGTCSAVVHQLVLPLRAGKKAWE